MDITLDTEIEKFLQAEVTAGNFPSVEAAVEASVRFMMESSARGPMSEDLLDKIDEAERAIARGEVYTVDDVKQRLGAKFGIQFG